MEAKLLKQELSSGELHRILEEIGDVNDNMRRITKETCKEILFILFSLILLYVFVLPCNTKVPLPLLVLGAVFCMLSSFCSIREIKLVERRTISVGGQEFIVGGRKFIHISHVLLWATFSLLLIGYLSFNSKPCSV